MTCPAAWARPLAGSAVGSSAPVAPSPSPFQVGSGQPLPLRLAALPPLLRAPERRTFQATAAPGGGGAQRLHLTPSLRLKVRLSTL